MGFNSAFKGLRKYLPRHFVGVGDFQVPEDKPYIVSQSEGTTLNIGNEVTTFLNSSLSSYGWVKDGPLPGLPDLQISPHCVFPVGLYER
jgi:hypothetical protein